MLTYQDKLRYLHKELGTWYAVESRLGLSHTPQGKTLRRYVSGEHKPTKAIKGRISEQYTLAKRRENTRRHDVLLVKINQVQGEKDDYEEFNSAAKSEKRSLANLNDDSLAQVLQSTKSLKKKPSPPVTFSLFVSPKSEPQKVDSESRVLFQTELSTENILKSFIIVKRNSIRDDYLLTREVFMQDLVKTHPVLAENVRKYLPNAKRNK